MVNSQYPEIISLQVNREILYFVPTETGSVRVFRYGLITMGVGEMEFSDWYFPGKIDLVRIERLSKNKIRELMEEKGLAGLLQQT